MNILKILQTIIAIHKAIVASNPVMAAEAHANYPNTYPEVPKDETVGSADSQSDEEEDDEDYETPFQQMCAKHALQNKIDDCIDDIVTAEANRVAGKILKRLGK